MNSVFLSKAVDRTQIFSSNSRAVLMEVEQLAGESYKLLQVVELNILNVETIDGLTTSLMVSTCTARGISGPVPKYRR